MIRSALAALLLLALAVPAQALTRNQLDRVAADPPPGARLPEGSGLIAGDRPAVLILADFDCKDLCNPVVAQAASALADTGLSPAGDYQLVVAALDPRDSRAAAEAFLDEAISDPDLRRAAALRLPGEAATDRLTQALGYTAVYDPERDAYAHPLAVYILTAKGAVARVLPALAFDSATLRSALVKAGQGAVGNLVERIAMTCFAFDPETGRYNLVVERALMIGMPIGMLVTGGGIALALRRERRRRGAP